MKRLFTVFVWMLAIATVHAQLARSAEALNNSSTCTPVTVLPWMENFDTVVFPLDCWTIVRENAAAAANLTWARNTASPRPGGSVAHARHMNMATSAAQVQTSWLILPALTIPETGVYELNFWTRFSAPMQIGRKAVYVSTTDTELASFSLVQNLTLPAPAPPPLSGWQENIISLEQFAGQTIHIAFRYVCRGPTLPTSNWDIDDVLVQRAPIRVIAQTPETNAFGVSIGDDITLSFNQDITIPNMSDITVTPALAGMHVSLVDYRHLMISHANFAYSTVYTVTVPAGTVVGLADTITWAFRSAPTCAAPTQMADFSHDFEPIQGILVFPPDCWLVHSENPDAAITGGAIATWVANNNSPRPGGSAWQARHPGPLTASPTQTSWLITEQIAIPAGVHELVFWTRWVSPANNGRTALYISTATNDMADFALLQELTPGGISSWQERVVSLEAFAGQSIYLAFKYVSRDVNLTTTTWDIDDVVVQESELRLLSLTPENTTLEVELDQDIVLEFNIDITASNLANITVVPEPAGMNINIVNNRTVVITHNGLAYETTYVVTVPAGTIIGKDEAIIWRFRTEVNCELPVSFPWTEGFEGFPYFPNTAAVFPPNCWTMFRTNPNAPANAAWQRNTTTPRPGGSTGQMRHPRVQLTAAQPENTSWMITRAVEIPSTGLVELNFWDRFSWGDNGGQFDILISNTTNELDAFQQLHSVAIIPGTSTIFSAWRENAIPLAPFAGDTVYFAFRVIMNPHPGTGTAPFTAGWDIDDIAVQTTPIRAASLTPERDAIDAERNQDIVVAFNQDVTYTSLASVMVTPALPNMNVSLVNNRYLTITYSGLLAPSTTYLVTVPPGTIVGYDNVITWSFRTAADCSPLIATQVVENFDFAIWPPDCWRVVRENPAVDETWVRNTATPLRPGSVAHARHTALPHATAPQTSWLITRAIRMPETGIFDLRFWARWVAPANLMGAAVYVSTTGNDTADFRLLQEFTSGSLNTWQEKLISLEAFAGQDIYLAFKYVGRGTSLASSAWDIDDVSIQEATELRVVATTPAMDSRDIALDQDIVVTFNIDATYTNLDAITVYPELPAMNVSFVNNRSITITHGGFALATVYTVTIPGGTLVGLDDTVTLSFRTEPMCVPATLPLAHNFSDLLFPPDCWTIYRENLAVAATWTRAATEPLRPGSTGHARHPQSGIAGQTSWMITPDIQLPATGIFELSFWDRFFWGDNGGSVGVWISTTDKNPTSFQLLQAFDIPPGVGATPWLQRIISLSEFAGETIYIAFRMQATTATFSATWDIDEVLVSQVFPYDVTIFAINEPTSGINLSATDTVRVTVENVGLNEISTVPIVLMLDETILATETITTPIPAGETFVHTFATTANLSAFGEHQITVFTTLAGDGNIENDTLRKTVVNNTLPHVESFELTTGNSLADGWTRRGPTVAPGNIGVRGAWVSTDRFRMVIAGEQPPFDGDRQMYVELWGIGPATDAWLFSPRVVLEEGVMYEVSFALRKVNLSSGLDGFKVQIGRTTEIMDSFAAGTMIDATTLFMDVTRFHGWEVVTLRYTPSETGVHYLGFHVFTTSGTGGNAIFLDKVRISEVPNYNLELITNFPYTQLPLSQTRQGRIPAAQARNTGLLEQTNVVLSATLDNVLIGESAPVASLAPGDTSPVMSIAESLNITEPGNHTLTLTVEGNQGSYYTDYTATFNFTTTENVFAKDMLDAPIQDGVGFGTGGIFAKVFEVTQTTTLCAVQVLFAARGSGDVSAYTILVFRMDGPTTPVLPAMASRSAQRIPGTINVVDFSQGSLVILEPGRYAIALFMAGFADISFDGRPDGGWYAMDPSTGAMTHWPGGQGAGSLGLRMVINDEFSLEPIAKAPAENATDIARDANIVVMFNTEIKPINLSSITLNPPVSGMTPSVVGNQLIIAHDGLAAGTLYTVTIPEGAVSSAVSGAGYNETLSWMFTSVFTPADFTDPFDLAVDVDYTTATLTWNHGVTGDVIYTQGFEGTTGTSLPTGWTTTGQTWVTAGEIVVAPRTGTRQFASGWNFGGPAWAFSRGTELTAGETYTISFWWQAPGYPTYNEPDNFRVRIGTAQTAGAMIETIIEQNTTAPTGVTSWAQVVFEFTPTTSGRFYLGFERIHPHMTGNRILIDDISITTAVKNAESFTVFLGPNANAMDSIDNVTELSFVFKHLPLNNYVAGVQAVGPGGLRSNIIPVPFSITEQSAYIEILDRTPGIDATDVALNAAITVTFDRPITATTLPGDITLDPQVSGIQASISGAVLTITHDGLAHETSYKITIPAGTVADFNEAIAWMFTTVAGTRVQLPDLETAIVIYPNPVDDILHINTNESVKRIEIFDLQGSLVVTIEDITPRIDVSRLPAGLYVIRFTTETNVVTQRFVKR